MHSTTSDISYFRYVWHTLWHSEFFLLLLSYLCSVCYPVAERISAERGEAVGDTVGYKVLINCYIISIWCISGKEESVHQSASRFPGSCVWKHREYNFFMWKLSWFYVSCACSVQYMSKYFSLSYSIFLLYCRYVWSQKEGRIHQSCSAQMVFFWEYW